MMNQKSRVLLSLAILLIPFFFAVSVKASSIYPEFVIARGTGSTASNFCTDESIHGVAIDSGSNVIIAGVHCATSDPSPGYTLVNTGDKVLNDPPNTQNGSGNNPFLAKYSNSGSLSWFKNSTVAYGTMYDVAVDPSDNIYVVGYNSGSNYDLDPDNVVSGDTISGSAFIGKYNSSGVGQWFVTPSTVYRDIEVDASGNIFVSGDDGLAKYNTSGTLQFSKTFSANWIERVEIDGTGNIYLVGSTTAASLDFDPDNAVGGDTPTLSGSRDAVFAKYNSSGVLQWVKVVGNTDGYAHDLALDGSNDVYVVGSFAGSSIDFDSANVVSGDTVSSNGGSDAFVAKYNSSGIIQWLKNIGGNSTDSAETAEYNVTQGLVIAFELSSSGSIDFDPSNSIDRDTLTASSATAMVTASYSTAGVLNWTKLSARQSGLGTINPTDLAITNTDIVVAGSFNERIDFDPDRRVTGDVLDDIDRGSGRPDGFWVKYSSARDYYEVNNLVSPLDVRVYKEYSLPSYPDISFGTPGRSTNLLSDLTAKDVAVVKAADLLRLKKIANNALIAEITAVNGLSSDMDWTPVTADSDLTLGKSFTHNLASSPGVGGVYTLFVPKLAGHSKVTICPNATTLDEVQLDCPNPIVLGNGAMSPYQVSTVTVNSVTYWRIAGVTGTGGISGAALNLTTPTSFSLTPNASNVSTTQDVVVSFTASAEYGIGDQIAIDFATGGTFTLANCASATTNADGVGGNDGAGVATTNGGPNNDRFMYTFTAATTAASTTGINICIAVTSPATALNYKVDLYDSLGAFAAGFYYVGNENLLNVIGHVDPVLTLVVRNTADTADQNNVFGATGPNLCNLGNLSDSGIQSCSYRLKVTTNSATGYAVNIQTNGNLAKGGDFIDNVVEDSTNVTPGVEGYGIELQPGSSTSGTVTPAGAFSDNDSPIGTGTNTTLYSSNGGNNPLPTDLTNTALVIHKAEADSSTPAGTYTQLVTYTVSASF